MKDQSEWNLSLMQLKRNLGPIIKPVNMNTEIIFKVHDKHYVEFLNVAWKEWLKLGLGGEAIPTVWPSRSMLQMLF